MGEFRFHRVKFFNMRPGQVIGLAFEPALEKLAVIRSVQKQSQEDSDEKCSVIEIWNTSQNFYQEQVWSADNGKLLEAAVWCDKRLFTTGLHGDIHEYDLMHHEIKHSVSADSGPVWCICTNHSQNKVAVGTEDGCIAIFDVADGDLSFWKSLDRQESRILSIAWHEAENVIVTGSIDNIRVWSISSGHAIMRLTPGRSEDNKETLVWTLLVTPDFTIVSGDSRGKVTFWSGRDGVASKVFQSHRADVLAVCQTPSGQEIFAAGVHPLVVCFKLTQVCVDRAEKAWTRGETLHNLHTHDIRALAWVKMGLVSAGVDCQLTLSCCKETTYKKVKVIFPFPHRSLCHVAPDAHLLLLQYTSHLSLWKLGRTDAPPDSAPGVHLVSENPVQLLKLRSRDDEQIMSSAISNTGSHLAYSENRRTVLFGIKLGLNCSSCSVTKICNLPVSHCMSFTPDGSRLVLATCQGQLLVVSSNSGQVISNLKVPDDRSSVHLLVVSPDGKLLAAADHLGNVLMFDLTLYKVHCWLPKHSDGQATTLCFHPEQPYLFIVYTNNKMFEYDYSKNNWTAFGQQLSEITTRSTLGLNTFCQSFYHPKFTHQVWLQGCMCLVIIDKSQRLPLEGEHLLAKGQNRHCFHHLSFKFLHHANVLANGDVCSVEQLEDKLMEQLPPVLKIKKFGT